MSDTPRTDALEALIDRALKIMAMAGYGVAVHDADHNNPVIAWMADARSALEGKQVTVTMRKPERYLGGMEGESRRIDDDQRQGADSPTSASNPSAAQDYAPARNNAQSTVGALQEATETPRVQSAPATLPWCGCMGPWCEGREDRNGKVKCLGYQIDSDGMAGVGACATCGAPQDATIVQKIDTLATVCSDMNERVGALERRQSLLREPVSSQPSTAPSGTLNKPAGMA